MGGILSRIVELERKVAEQDRRNRNRRRTGTIKEADHAKGLYRVLISEQDGSEFLTGWIKPRQMAAGGVKIDVLLSAGEQVDIVSESGDLTDARIEMSDYSEQQPRENASVPFAIKVGGTMLELSSGEVAITAASGHLK